MTKRIFVCGLLMSLASLVLAFVVHGLLLGSDYAALTGTLMRSPADQQRFFPLMLVSHLLVGMTMTWLYAQGFNAARPSLGQGIRFGIAVALLAAVPLYLVYFAVQPTPAALTAQQILFDGLRFVLLGGLVAYLHPQRTSLPDR